MARIAQMLIEAAGAVTPNAVLVIGMFSGAFVAGFSGFGLAAAAGAFLFHVFDPKIAVPLMMLCSILAQTMGMICLRRSVDVRPAIPFVIGGMLGLPFAVLIFKNIDSDTFRLLFGVFLVLYAAWTLMRLAAQSLPARQVIGGILLNECPKNRAGSKYAIGLPRPVVGFLSGIVGGMTAMPGVIVSVWADANGLNKSQQRGFVQPFILTMQIGALAIMSKTTSVFSGQVMSLFWIALLPLLLGSGLGLFCYGRCSTTVFRIGVLVIVLCSGTGLLVF